MINKHRNAYQIIKNLLENANSDIPLYTVMLLTGLNGKQVSHFKSILENNQLITIKHGITARGNNAIFMKITDKGRLFLTRIKEIEAMFEVDNIDMVDVNDILKRSHEKLTTIRG